MFVLKAILMLILPFYRVNLPSHIYSDSAIYREYSHGRIVKQVSLNKGDKAYIELIQFLKKQQTGWKYDLATYVPKRVFLSSDLTVNCLNDNVVINYKSDGDWVQVSKKTGIACPTP